MPSYVCNVRDTRGKSSTKTIDAEGPDQVRKKLREQGLFVTGITEKTTTDEVAGGVAKKFRGKVRVKLRDRTVFSRQFATMIDAGVALVRTLNILSEQTENKRFAMVITQIKDKVEQGSALSDAMKDYPTVFDKLYVSMVRAGESGGVLDEVLARVAGFLEAQAKLMAQIKSAMTYPIAVLVIASGIFIFLMTFILPIFKDMFQQMGAKLPAFTEALINISNVMREQGIFVALGFGAGVFAFTKIINTVPGRKWWDNFKLNAPIFGPLTRKVAVARFTRTLGTLLRSGVPLISSLEIVQDTAGNVHVASAVEKVRHAVLEGESMTRPLESTGVFPPMVTQMISIGEETGAVDAMLEKVADFYDSEVEAAVKALTSLLEPLMMVGIGGMVGSIIIGMYLPMFEMVGKFGG